MLHQLKEGQLAMAMWKLLGHAHPQDGTHLQGTSI